MVHLKKILEPSPLQSPRRSPMDVNRSHEVAAQIYGVESWGFGYFFITEDGNLAVAPYKNHSRSVDIYHVVQELAVAQQTTPLLLRFPQILEERMSALHEAFKAAIEEFQYEKPHLAVYPSKVNQRAGIVEHLTAIGSPYNYGLEVGSKAELAAALAMPLTSRALLICNGLKDDLFLRAAMLSEKVGKNAVIVVEETAEILAAFRIGHELNVIPQIGIRVKLSSRGSGKWEESGGEFAKFGMSTPELVGTLHLLKRLDRMSTLKMLHFHIGSQVTDIQRAKQAFKEAARVYAKAHKLGCKIEYLNVGGGLGVDYDGSRTASDFSTNYSAQEFANDVVYTIGEICGSEGVPPPTIVTESGRALVAYHSILVTEVKKVVAPGLQNPHIENSLSSESEHILELTDLDQNITRKNFREYYHDAVQQREDLNSLFELGYLDLTDKAWGEQLFWKICRQASKFSREMEQRPKEFEELDRMLAAKYVCNFSVFQSLPDSWAFNQLFPVMPIHRLNEMPTERGILCDITCDSDGTVNNFVGARYTKKSLELHNIREGEPYYLAFLLVGAYQETLGDLHNLFGVVSEATVTIDEDNNPVINEVTCGDSVREVLKYSGYNAKDLQVRVARQLEQQKESGLISDNDERDTMETFAKILKTYTYLE